MKVTINWGEVVTNLAWSVVILVCWLFAMQIIIDYPEVILGGGFK